MWRIVVRLGGAWIILKKIGGLGAAHLGQLAPVNLGESDVAEQRGGRSRKTWTSPIDNMSKMEARADPNPDVFLDALASLGSTFESESVGNFFEILSNLGHIFRVCSVRFS